jgi:uncharacterized membrane protein YccC
MLPALPAGVTWPAVSFALRTTAASVTALYIAFLLDFEEPKWAAMTVWIVAQGSRGMSLSKSQYRLLGTVIGAAMAMVLVAAFGQAPDLFFLALAAWLALCTALSTALRNFRSYGAVLAGYTAAIIGIGASSQPTAIFDIATARVVYIGLGIIVEAVFTAVFAPGTPLTGLRQRLDAYLRQTAAICSRALRGEDNSAALRRLFAGAVDLDSTGEYAAASSLDLRRRFGHLRGAVAASLAQLASAQTLREHLARSMRSHDPLVVETAGLFDRLARDPAAGASAVATLAKRIADDAAEAEDDAGDDAGADPASSRLLILDRLDQLLVNAHEALVRQALLADPDAPPSRLSFRFHFDRVAALQNALRSFVAVLAAAAFWIATAWSSGASVVVIVAVICSLFATRPNAIAGGLGFMKGAAAAIAAATVCNFVLLPAVSGFAALVAVASPFLIAGGIAMRHPRTAAPATSFTLFVWDLIGPDNAARADFGGFLNGSLALLLGIGCGTLVFALLLPANPLRVRQRLHAAVRHDLASVGRDPERWSQHAWLTRTADRFSRQLVTDPAVSAENSERELRGMLASLTIGHAAIALHALRSEHAGVARTIGAVLDRLGDGDPLRLARLGALAARRLARLAHGPAGTDRRLLRGAMLLEDIAHSAAAHADFLRGRP